MPTLTVGNHKILLTKLQGGMAFGKLHIEAYHMAGLLGYAQQHSVRKQVQSDWADDFEEGPDYQVVHDPELLKEYESLHRRAVGALRAVKPARGRMFLTVAGLAKVLRHTSKDSDWLKQAVTPYYPSSAAPEDPARADEETRGAVSDEGSPELDRRAQYEILETLLEHLKHMEDPALKKLALISAELGLGRKLDDVRELLGLGLKPNTPAVETRRGRLPTPEPAHVPLDDAARAYLLLSKPVTQGALLDDIPNVYTSLTQIGAKAGGFSALQAGKAADIVAARLGHSHNAIRRKKLSFNDLPELPDSTSGKLRKMYRFNSRFSNHVIVELRSNPRFTAVSAPDIGPWTAGGEDFPKLSQAPLDD